MPSQEGKLLNYVPEGVNMGKHVGKRIVLGWKPQQYGVTILEKQCFIWFSGLFGESEPLGSFSRFARMQHIPILRYYDRHPLRHG